MNEGAIEMIVFDEEDSICYCGALNDEPCRCSCNVLMEV